MKRRDTGTGQLQVAPLIDVVFLLIIFFVVTASIERELRDETITLAQAKHSQAADKLPSSMTVNLHRNGDVSLGCIPVSLPNLQSILTATAVEQGNWVPVIIRSDADTLYNEVDRVMEAISHAQLRRIRLSARAGKE